jgi:hypothetical protein
LHHTISPSGCGLSALQTTGRLPNRKRTGANLNYVLTICALKRFVSLFGFFAPGAENTTAMSAILAS